MIKRQNGRVARGLQIIIDNITHIIPIDDWEHNTDGIECRCNPSVETYENVTVSYHHHLWMPNLNRGE